MHTQSQQGIRHGVIKLCTKSAYAPAEQRGRRLSFSVAEVLPAHAISPTTASPSL